MQLEIPFVETFNWQREILFPDSMSHNQEVLEALKEERDTNLTEWEILRIDIRIDDEKNRPVVLMG